MAVVQISHSDIDPLVLRTAVASLPRGRQFRTKAVSAHPTVLAAHAAVSAARNYHAVVGKMMREHADVVGVRLVGTSRTDEGRLWEHT